MTTIRIYVEHDGPLDGVSPLHPESTSAWNHELGLLEILESAPRRAGTSPSRTARLGRSRL